MKLSTTMTTIAAIALLLSSSTTTNAFSTPPTASHNNYQRISLLQSSSPSNNNIAAAKTTLRMTADATAAATASAKTIDLMEEADMIFDSIDVNQDGSISTDELRSHLVETMGYAVDSPQCRYLFDAMDIDNSGEISRQEMRSAFATGAVQLFTTFGLGGNTLQEGNEAYNERIQQITSQRGGNNNQLLLDDLADMVFDLLDANQSGLIDRDELRQHFDMVVSQPQGAPTENQTREYVDTIMMVLDKNSDGVISKTELRDAFQKYNFRFLMETLGLPVYKRRDDN